MTKTPDDQGTPDAITDKGIWHIWDKDSNYGEVLYKRAVGESPEMESSKAAAKQLIGVIQEGDSILDVGCGAGHYLRSLRNVNLPKFNYTGMDATAPYIELANKAFKNEPNVSFSSGDIFSLPADDQAFDVVMCNNVLLHLPSVAIPLKELCRVAGRFVMVRLLCGSRSFRTMDVHPQENGDDFQENGEPRAFHYFNIYSKKSIEYMLSKIPRIQNYEIIEDRDYSVENITKAVAEQKTAHDVTTMVGHSQVNGYILLPWSFLKITLKPS